MMIILKAAAQTRSELSVAVQKFAISRGQVRNELLNQGHAGKLSIPESGVGQNLIHWSHHNCHNA
jgi:hypothetical protein